MDTIPLMRYMFNGGKLKELREEKFWSQRTLGAHANVSPTTIMQLETAQNVNPRLMTVRKIADALGVDPNELVDRG